MSDNNSCFSFQILYMGIVLPSLQTNSQAHDYKNVRTSPLLSVVIFYWDKSQTTEGKEEDKSLLWLENYDWSRGQIVLSRWSDKSEIIEWSERHFIRRKWIMTRHLMWHYSSVSKSLLSEWKAMVCITCIESMWWLETLSAWGIKLGFGLTKNLIFT